MSLVCKLRWLAGLLLIEVAALQALEIEAFVFAAFAGSAQALGEGRVWLQECLAGTRLKFRTTTRQQANSWAAHTLGQSTKQFYVCSSRLRTFVLPTPV